ncbi:hypothetical protein, partial [Streptomyces sp. NPDC058758]|uniref:hypothetical protein n=1 Tax=Streptomyces sp. NPDC058758 TaxID=3346627 RepID=UPI0036B529B0
GAAIEQMLFTTDWLTGVRGAANATLTEQADSTYRLAYALSGGGELHPDAHSAALADLLHSMTPGIVAFALHHLRRPRRRRRRADTPPAPAPPFSSPLCPVRGG